MIYSGIGVFYDIQNRLLDVETFINQCDGNKKWLEYGVTLCDMAIDISAHECLFLYDVEDQELNHRYIEQLEEAKKQIKQAIEEVDKHTIRRKDW